MRKLLKDEKNKDISVIITNEAGASVYSASELASKELPKLDVSLRGAVSIARRLQDPLAELVKIAPRSIGVGQYQHDLPESELDRNLDAVVEDCVNYVGVDLNTASTHLLERISGIKKNIAANIVKYRDENGAFTNRLQLLKVSRLGEKAFEQCAGFLRVVGGDNILDNSSVHPESYGLVLSMAKDLGVDVSELVGNTELLNKIDPIKYVDNKYGLPTIRDILSELQKPGRDPRGEFESVEYAEGIETIEDLKSGMILNGIVTNVADFGAFVDIGVHQDGLVHRSKISNVYVENLHDFIKPGEKVRVMVDLVDLERNRIDLTMKFEGSATIREKPTNNSNKSNKPNNKLNNKLNNKSNNKPNNKPNNNPNKPNRVSTGSTNQEQSQAEQTNAQSVKPTKKSFDNKNKKSNSQNRNRPVKPTGKGLFNASLFDKLSGIADKLKK